MSVLEQFKHADTFAQMSFGDKMAATGQVIVLGMLITFTVLVLLWVLINLMTKVIVGSQKPKETVKVVEEAKAPVTKNASVEDEELIAVITAAVAASLNTSLHNIVVTNITRVDDATPAWGKAGRSDVMNSRL